MRCDNKLVPQHIIIINSSSILTIIINNNKDGCDDDYTMIIIMRMRRRRRFGRDNKLVPLQLGTSTTPSSPYLTMNIMMVIMLMMTMIMMMLGTSTTPSSPYLTMNIVMRTYMMMIMVMVTMITQIQTCGHCCNKCSLHYNYITPRSLRLAIIISMA